MTRVALSAPSRLALASIEALLHGDHHLTVVARSTRLESLADRAWTAHADVALVAASDAARLRSVLASVDEDVVLPPLVVLGDAGERASIAQLVRRGVRAFLPADAGAREISTTLEAVAAGLTVLSADALAALTPDGARESVAVAHTTSRTQHPLSPREREILALVAEGLGNKIVAARLGISEHTVKTHVTSIFEKLGAESRAEAVAIGARTGVILL